MYRILKPGRAAQAERFVICSYCGCEFFTDRLGEFVDGETIYATCPWCHKNIAVSDTWHNTCGDCKYCSSEGLYTCSRENNRKVNRIDEACAWFVKDPERRPDV